ncbi:hypothetical protein E3N88_36500 [Mikania micrantha]|uniref:FLZ-type domain-containing protein n=1 Tax=Mikania micrantha TaxID=192012 RepID=A0A5N6M3V9_9ASTR|nr:hypothetical protein E3N88_36500 [Mikania micrantha]
MATTQNPTKPISSFLGSTRFFNGFFMAKSLYDAELSPTSVLNPFGFKQTPLKPRKIFEEINNPLEKFESEPVSECKNGIALALIQENPIDSLCKSNAVSRKVMFASHLNIQIPSNPLLCCDFGIKTRKFQFGGHMISNGSGSLQSSMNTPSLSEMELSEEYTRSDSDPNTSCESFLSFCHACKKNLEDDCDIFMYRGEKAFCCEECRCQEMVLDGLMNSEKMLI